MALLGHRPPLDGLRALAFLGVFAGHGELVPGGDSGAVAMFLFFALSGFLITSLLVGERWTTGTVSLRRFFGRRALRLLPALALFLMVWVAVIAVFGHDSWTTSVPQGGPGGPEPFLTALHAAAVSMGYFMNWAEVLGMFGHYVAIGHVWSLSVEEQFYLVWAPIVAVLVAWRLRGVAVAALVLAAGSLAEVPLLYHGGAGELRVYMGTDTRAAAFLLGAALAVLWCRGTLSWLRRPAVALIVAGLAGLVLLWAASPLSGPGAVLGPRSETAVFLARWYACTAAAPVVVVAAASVEAGALWRALSGSTLTYIGRRSYALYLWHYVWLTWFRALGLIGVAAAFVASLACAEASWQLVERRALAQKRRLDPPSRPTERSPARQRVMASPPGPAGAESGASANAHGITR